jgi:hypothetical protein
MQPRKKDSKTLDTHVVLNLPAGRFIIKYRYQPVPRPLFRAGAATTESHHTTLQLQVCRTRRGSRRNVLDSAAA